MAAGKIEVRVGVDPVLVASSLLPGKEAVDGVDHNQSRLFPWVKDPEDPKQIAEWLEKLKQLEQGATLVLVFEDGTKQEYKASKLNGLNRPFAGAPITMSTIVDYCKRGLGIAHNRETREALNEKFGAPAEAGGKAPKGVRGVDKSIQLG